MSPDSRRLAVKHRSQTSHDASSRARRRSCVLTFVRVNADHFLFDALQFGRMTTTTLTPREQLRAATSPAHHQLDDSLGERRLFESPQGYSVYLELMHFLHASCRDSLTWLSEHHPDLARDPSIEQLIANDLCELASHVTIPEAQSLPVWSNTTSPSAHWGRVYVLEGSVMGATHLLKTLKRQLPDVNATRYLSATPGDAKLRWPKVIEAINASVVDPDVAIQAALEVFHAAHEFLRQRSFF